METLIKRYQATLDALEELAEELEMFEKAKKEKRWYKTARNSIIQCFEYSFEITWKLLKDYFETVEGLRMEGFVSARKIFTIASTQKILNSHEFDQCLEMVVNRNQTSHIYHERMAEEIATQIPEYYKLLKTIVERLEIPPHQ